MPVLDTVVLFATADKEDRFHNVAKKHMNKLSTENANYWLASFALFEFDVVMKSRGFTNKQRMDQYSALIEEFPEVSNRILRIDPSTFFLASSIEASLRIDYFDAAIAAESLQKDGLVVSTDKVFDDVPNLKRMWD